ncbi:MULTISPECIES: carboxypeptidase-like regulatory domain-containing protein [unclassified Hahella]|uniref:DUF6795 domain-containing protein n=1 Tax=unclassified Hahella TaxID=2624107 RepID=UPI001C1EFFF3|nr:MULTISPECIES: carboxypeptidase-like regulatory domain-containing protein [unclassified Hahella]MBU6954607.1 DUF4198 domain-containing protein [Hahella sp. HN01]MDG9666921.1 DUF4198 domain-containing protein [Hahella sp. CR1]
MSIFDIGKVCLASQMSAVVTLNGEPIAGAQVQRTLTWGNDENAVEETSTDAQGRFQFPAYYSRTVSKYLPGQPVIHQKMIIRHDGQEYLAWTTSKLNFDEDSELGKDVKIRLKCDLADEESVKEGRSYVVKGICQLE